MQYWNCYNLEKSCLAYNEISNYVGKGKMGYAWSIYDLKIYDKPKDLGEFKVEIVKGAMPKKLIRPPQSWQYIESLGE